MIRITAVGFGTVGRQLDRERERFERTELRERLKRAGTILRDEVRRQYASSVTTRSDKGAQSIQLRLKFDRKNRDLFAVISNTGRAWYVRLLSTGTAERTSGKGRRGRVAPRDFFLHAFNAKKGDAERELESSFRVFTG